VNERLSAAPQDCVEDGHIEGGRFVDEGDGARADDAQRQWQHDAHHKNHQRVEAEEQ